MAGSRGEAADSGVEVLVLGPLEVRVGGVPLHLGGPRPRAVLAVLAAEPNRVVPMNRIIDVIWGEGASDGAAATVQVHVSHLRRALAPAAAWLGKDMIVTQRPGYLLSVPEGAHDLLRVRRLLERARALIPSDPAGAVAELDAALACWRGEPLSDIAGDDLARNLAAGLASLRDTAFDDRAEVALGLERHAEELAALTAGVSVDPFNERRRGLLMMALYRCGRQAEALEVYQEGRRVLVDELGISPSPALRALEADILDHAPGLALAAPPRLVAERPTVRTGGIVVPSAWLEAGGELLALVEAVTTIGRSADRHVVIEGDKVSRSHAEIRVAGGEHVLVDQGSTNGTTVNGERIVRARLADGDEIGIGPARLRFVSRG